MFEFSSPFFTVENDGEESLRVESNSFFPLVLNLLKQSILSLRDIGFYTFFEKYQNLLYST